MRYPQLHRRTWRSIKGTREVYLSWGARCWSVGLYLGIPDSIGFWWRFWLTAKVPKPFLTRLWLFFDFAILDDMGIAWDIRKGSASDYWIRFLVVTVEITFQQKTKERTL